jgi:hypothetical protein
MTEINLDYVPAYLINSDGTISTENLEEAERVSEGVMSTVSQLPPTEQVVALILLKSDLLPQTSEDWSAEKIAGTLERLAAAAVSIAEIFATSGGPDEIARLMIQQYFLLLKEEVDTRSQSRKMQHDLMLHQADKQRRSANKFYQGAMVNLMVNVLVTAIAIVSALQSIQASTKQGEQSQIVSDNEKAIDESHLKDQQLVDPDSRTQNVKLRNESRDNITKANIEARKFYLLAENYKNAATVFQGLGQGLGGFLSAQYQLESKEHEADGTEYGAKSGYEGGESDVAREFQNQFMEMIRSSIEQVRALFGADEQAMEAISRNARF